MNFRPNNIFLGENTDGSPLRVEEWKYDVLAGYELAGGLVHIFWFIVFGFLLSPFLLYLTLLVYCGRFNILNIVGLLVSCFLLYDASYGGFFTSVMVIIFNESMMNIIIYLNVISLVIHAFLIVFGTITHKVIVSTVKDETMRYGVFITLLIFLGFIGILITAPKISNVGWLRGNIERNIDKIEHKREVLDSIEHLKTLKILEEKERYL